MNNNIDNTFEIDRSIVSGLPKEPAVVPAPVEPIVGWRNIDDIRRTIA